MSNFTIEITAPTIVATLEKLIAALASKISTPVLLPQTPAERANRQRVIPGLENFGPVPDQSAVMPRPSAPQPTYTPPTAAPVAQPQYTVPAQQYQSAPVNPTPAPQPVAPVAPAAVAPTAPTTPQTPVVPVAAAPAYQVDDLARAAAQLMDAGKQQECLALLSQFQVRGLGDLRPEQFGEFATALRQIGAKI